MLIHAAFQVDAVDDTVALAIEEMLQKSAASGTRFYVSGASPGVMAVFSRLQIGDKITLPPDTPRQAALELAIA